METWREHLYFQRIRTEFPESEQRWPCCLQTSWECPDEPQKVQVVEEEDEEVARAVPIAGDSSWRHLRLLSSCTNTILTAALSRSSLSKRYETNEL